MTGQVCAALSLSLFWILKQSTLCSTEEFNYFLGCREHIGRYVSCYTAHGAYPTAPFPRDEAITKCKEVGGNLAVINSEDTQTWLKERMNNTVRHWFENFWIGAQFVPLPEFQWINGVNFEGMEKYLIASSDATTNGRTSEQFAHLMFDGPNTTSLSFSHGYSKHESGQICIVERDDCTDDWIKCFRNGHSTSSKTWYDARNICIKMGGDLATFDTVTFLQFLAQYLPSLEKHSPYFIGLHNLNLTWPTAQTSRNSDRFATYTNWDYGEPKSYHDNYDFVNYHHPSGKWRAATAATRGNVLCERSTSETTISSTCREFADGFSNTHSSNGLPVQFATLQECKNYCTSLPTCVAVDWDRTCWIHISLNDLMSANTHYYQGVTQYQLISRTCVTVVSIPTTPTTVTTTIAHSSPSDDEAMSQSNTPWRDDSTSSGADKYLPFVLGGMAVVALLSIIAAIGIICFFRRKRKSGQGSSARKINGRGGYADARQNEHSPEAHRYTDMQERNSHPASHGHAIYANANQGEANNNAEYAVVVTKPNQRAMRGTSASGHNEVAESDPGSYPDGSTVYADIAPAGSVDQSNHTNHDEQSSKLVYAQLDFMDKQ